MATEHLLDSELRPLLELYPDNFTFSRDMLPRHRADRAKRIVMGDTERTGVSRNTIEVPGFNGPDVTCLLYQPEQAQPERPGYLHIHGGGYIGGSAEASDIQNLNIARKLNTTVLSVNYRLSPECSIPGPLDDCYAALAWFSTNSTSLGVDPSRIAIGGESAGGGLAAALGIMARDRAEYDVCHQHLTYPMLDNLTGSSGHEGDPLVGEFVWTREHNQFGWECYLGDAEPIAPQVPARLNDFSNLPPTWMFTAALDLFRDENIRYAEALLRAGVATDLIVYPGACHGFQFVPGTRLSKRFTRDHLEGLARGLGVNMENIPI